MSGPDRRIFTGSHNLLSQGNPPHMYVPMHVTVEKKSEKNCLRLSTDGEVHASLCTGQLPYVCYREQDNNTVLNECGTFDNKYQLDGRTGSCYKLHDNRQEWSRAHMICEAEGGYLVILNNEEEASMIKDMSSNRTLKVAVSLNFEPLFIGLIDLNKDGDWTTIHGEKVEKVYHTWAPHQPDNKRNQYCGSLLMDGSLDDTWCDAQAMFVCEKDPKTIRFEPQYNQNTDQ